MTKEERNIFVEENESTRFYLKENDLFYSDNNKKVNNLAVLVDFSENEIKENPIVLKYGNYKDVFPFLNEYTKANEISNIFNVKIIEVPNDMYKWVDILFDISASNWANHLVEELESRKN